MKNLFKKSLNSNTQTGGFSVNTEVEEIIEDTPAERRSFTGEILEWLEVMVAAIVAVVIIFTLVFRIATIDGDSMLNTLVNGERVVITNFNYEPKQFDIVVISRNIDNSASEQNLGTAPIIKRVIAVGGQTVDIDFTTGEVFVDGKLLKEDYISTPTTRSEEVTFPLYVPEGYIFVLGDNRAVSLDSRSADIGEGGLVDTRYVLGHAIFRIFPLDRIGRLDNK